MTWNVTHITSCHCFKKKKAHLPIFCKTARQSDSVSKQCTWKKKTIFRKMQQTVLFSPHPCLAVWHQGQLSIQQTNLAEVWGLRERSGRFINQSATLNGFPNEVKSLQGLILYHLRGATCSTAIIGKDGTATISRKREGTGTDTEEKKCVCGGGGGLWWTDMGKEREGDGQRGNKLEKGQRSQTLGCQTHANHDTQCVAANTTREGNK